MPDKVVDIPGVGVVAFPDSMSDDAIAASSAKLIANKQPAKPSDSGGAVLAAGSRALPALANAAAEVATNPNVPKVGAAIGRAVGAVGPTVVEAAQGSGMGALTAAALSGKTAWAGGKAGWFTSKLAQSAAGPVARALDAVAPYAQTAATLSGAQGAVDLAQMAEPGRKDLGFLGIGGGTPDPNHPALLNLLAMKASDGIGWLIKQGLSLGDASRTYWNLKAKS